MTTQSKTKFIIFGQSRTGSNLLIDLLKNHSEIHLDYEIYNREVLFTNIKPLQYLFRAYPLPYANYRLWKSNKPVYGFKLLFFQVQNPEKLLSRLHHNNWKFIHIHRDDIWQIALSNIIALETNRWHSYSENESTPKSIKIKPERLFKALEIRTNWKIKENTLIEPYDHIKINYEKDLKDSNNWQATADKIFSYLGLESHPVTTTMKTTYQKPYSELIENYDELTRLVMDSEFAYLLPQNT
jgi:LPS sulfotransferase NodH